MISGLLSWMIFLPLIGAVVILIFLSKDNHKGIRAVTVIFTLIPFILSIMMLYAFDGTTSEWVLVLR